jgi:hypothetical protein
MENLAFDIMDAYWYYYAMWHKDGLTNRDHASKRSISQIAHRLNYRCSVGFGIESLKESERSLDIYNNLVLRWEKCKYPLLTLSEMINTEEYQVFESEVLLNSQYHLINNGYEIDIDYMVDAASDGVIGVRHRDYIHSWEEFLDTVECYDYFEGGLDPEEVENCDIKWFTNDVSINKIKKEIEKLWTMENVNEYIDQPHYLKWKESRAI